jgi:hypothetical protein
MLLEQPWTQNGSFVQQPRIPWEITFAFRRIVSTPAMLQKCPLTAELKRMYMMLFMLLNKLHMLM